MNASNHEAGQGQKKIPTIQEMESWNDEQLLKWIKDRQPKIFRDNDDVLTFKAAKISGSAFMEYAEDLDFFREIHLPLGVYRDLASLARKVKKQNDQSNQTAGQKRKEDETDLSDGSPISSKRRQKYKDKEEEEDEEKVIQLATEANKRRKAVKDIITQMNDSPDQHSDSIDPLPGAIDKLSDPTLNHTLDFPFIDSMPERFNERNIAKGKWLYMGRTMFKDFLDEVKEVRKSQVYRRCWLYGTQGFGKSHLLAALVCYFAAQDERVVYLPDCRGLLDDPVSYVKKAMLFAWADDFTTQKKIMALRTQDQIEKFFEYQENVIFVVDQMNAFKSDGFGDREVARQLRRWVIRFTSSHKTILSSSANSTDDLEEFKHQTYNWVVRVYGGFTKTEMKQWWRQHKGIKLRGYTRDKVEDFTGCIPLLLKQFVKNGEVDLTAPKFNQIYDDSVHFVQRIRSTVGNFDWKGYCAFVRACICNERVPPGWGAHVELIDHRYFYQRNDKIGRYTCGLVRDAVTNQLFELDTTFIDTGFLASLSDFVHNRCVVGYMMEYAILTSIRSTGLRICKGWDKPMKLRFFTQQKDIQFDIQDERVLYRPRQTNYKTIDGMILSIKTEEKAAKGKKPKLLIAPIQITVAKSHSNSYRNFLREYRHWVKGQLREFDIELEFLWITPDKCDAVQHPPYPPWPSHQERCIPFDEVSTDIYTNYQDAEKAGKENEQKETKKVEKADEEEEEVQEEKADEKTEKDQRSGRVTRSTIRGSRAGRSRAR
ncbi:uncharacterized protein Z518_11165 [Rhinocladiella mackenziei CBS 650.93]|uniref:SAM domain-containing protein n=1 Tax=Rhinocladiella mackenziei CBS 650.93 TaxID=1442369 RepID=A0A0D2GN02_9EURO|nr:uncharacterized protein Z518_11165 [Rhinocladiella mackenziei CBS 650.93]KIW99752.1 hypothetical protein Z518_11165 [Rhinocladiella mackenziei CBS 650.93]